MLIQAWLLDRLHGFQAAVAQTGWWELPDPAVSASSQWLDDSLPQVSASPALHWHALALLCRSHLASFLLHCASGCDYTLAA